MILPFTTPADIDPPSVFIITLESIIFGIAGVFIGMVIDKLFIRLSKKHKDHRLLLSVLQIALSGLVLGIMYVYASPFFTDHFQRTLSGLAFPALFYGVQSNIYSTWQDINIMV
jgi:ABC-type Fe3+ transport system permease subunit